MRAGRSLNLRVHVSARSSCASRDDGRPRPVVRVPRWALGRCTKFVEKARGLRLVLVGGGIAPRPHIAMDLERRARPRAHVRLRARRPQCGVLSEDMDDRRARVQWVGLCRLQTLRHRRLRRSSHWLRKAWICSGA